MILTIMPYYCVENDITHNCYNYDEDVIIYNKVRHNFHLKVGQGLTLLNLTIDSLDSIMSKY